jgi:hypothetical protein
VKNIIEFFFSTYQITRECKIKPTPEPVSIRVSGVGVILGAIHWVQKNFPMPTPMRSETHGWLDPTFKLHTYSSCPTRLPEKCGWDVRKVGLQPPGHGSSVDICQGPFLFFVFSIWRWMFFYAIFSFAMKFFYASHSMSALLLHPNFNCWCYHFLLNVWPFILLKIIILIYKMIFVFLIWRQNVLLCYYLFLCNEILFCYSFNINFVTVSWF